MKKLIFLLAFITISISCTDTSNSNQQEFVSFKKFNIAYGGHRLQKMDVFIPKNVNQNKPFVIWIHGGGWTEGDKNSGTAFQEFLYNNNIPSASINYRLTSTSEPEINYEEIFDDVDNAIKFIENKLNEWQLPNNGFVLAGHSAGGHLSLHRGYRSNLNIKGVTSLSAATFLDYLPALQEINNNPELINLINRLAGKKYEEDKPLPQEFYTISPIHYIKKEIPVLLIHGTADEVVPFSQATMFVDSLKVKEVKHTFSPYINAKHNLIFEDPNVADKVAKEFLDFYNSL